jgi:malate synthase
MEDAATCEISRAQIWQWIHHPRGVLENGRKVTADLFRTLMDEELEKIQANIGPDAYARGQYALAREVFDNVATREPFVEFLTLPAYERQP